MRNHVLSGKVKWISVVLTLAALATSALLVPRLSTKWVLLLFGAIGLVLLLPRPGLGLVVLAAFSFTLPLQIATGSDVSLTAPVFLIPAVVGAWLVAALRARSLRLPDSPATLPLVLFLAASFLSLAAGNAYWDPMIPRPANLLLVQLAQLAIVTLSAALFLLGAELGRQTRWLRLATFAFLAASAIVVLEYSVPGLWGIAGWSVAEMANSAMLWAWLAALATGQLLYNRSLATWARLALLVLLGGAAYAVWIVQHDWISGWLPFIVAVVTVAWLGVWRRNRATALVVGAALMGLALVLYPYVFAYVGGEQELQTSWGGRVVLYRAVLDLASQHPILGLGPAAYRHYAYTRWLSMGPAGALWLRPSVSSHNNLIDVYAQFGVVGLALFAWFLVALAALGRRAAGFFRGTFEDGYVMGALGGLAATVAAMMLVDWFLPFVYNAGFRGFRTSALAWMFLGGMAALEQQGRQATRRPRPRSG